jgi:hypothetical protein
MRNSAAGENDLPILKTRIWVSCAERGKTSRDFIQDWHPRFCLLVFVVMLGTSTAHADPANHNLNRSVEASCRIVEQAARAHQLPISVLTRLIWNESRFQPGAISRAGAQGIAQFMPGTSGERGLSNPFDPEHAIPEAAKFLAELGRRFGNVGLAVAAYNAGPGRVASWLNNAKSLPRETRTFVISVTGHSADQWAIPGQFTNSRAEVQSCAAWRSNLRDLRGNDAEGYRRGMLPIKLQSGDILPSMRHSGDILPSMRRSGDMLPSMRHSGDILSSMRHSARKRS